MFMLNVIALEQLTILYRKMVVKGDELKDALISNSKSVFYILNLNTIHSLHFMKQISRKNVLLHFP